jgi:dipeptidyl aminopeptidase/acylaminoacyl peptidase
LRAEAIVELLWLPDGRQLLYVNQEPAEPTGPPWPRHTLWLVDTQTGAQESLSSADLNVHRISISDDGRYVRALAGSDFGDACFMDRSLLFLDLNEPAIWLDLAAFDTVLNERPYAFFPADAGRWLSDKDFEINMSAFCMSEEMGTPPEDLALLSRYRFDLETMTAEAAGP